MMHQPIEIHLDVNNQPQAAYPDSLTENWDREPGQHAASQPLPRPVGSSRGGGKSGGVRGNRRTAVAVAVSASVLLFAGCAVGPNYKRPEVPNQTAWKEPAVTTNVTVLPTQWWTIFEDAELNALEKQAVGANQDLKRAMSRVKEARALTRVSKADLYPSISGNSAYAHERVSENRRGVPPGVELEGDDYSGSFDLSYELDVWGRVRRSIEAAKADAGATATDLEVVLLTLTSDVARNYQNIRSLDSERAVIEATIALRKDAVHLQEERSKAGLNNEMDATRARTELANVEAQLQSVLRNRAQIEHALAVLCGEAPGNFSVAVRGMNIIPPEIPAGLPSSLLERRPDVVEAEQMMQAESARIGVAKAAFFPTIKLTSTAGLASADLGSLVNWPSRMWSIGPSISVPIFEGDRNRANLAAAEARYEQSVASYRATVLKAFREVEDALSDLSTLATQNDATHRAMLSAQDTVTLANERYQKGLSSYLDVVDAQRAALDAERQDVQLHGQRAVSTILLAKALGGGWQRTKPSEVAEAK